MHKDPTRTLTRGIVDAVEHTPEFRAMREGIGFIPTSWGHLATQLMDADQIEPNPDAARDYLALSPEAFADPEGGVHTRRDLTYFQDRIERDRKEKYDTTNKQKAEDDKTRVKGWLDDWTVEDGKERADKIQDEIESIFREPKPTDPEEIKARDDRTSLMCLKRDALHDGQCMPLAEFIKRVDDMNDLGFYTQEDLATAMKSMLREIDRDFVIELAGRTEGVFLGSDQVDWFVVELDSIYGERRREFLKSEWQKLARFVIPSSIEDHPVMAGGEK